MAHHRRISRIGSHGAMALAACLMIGSAGAQAPPAPVKPKPAATAPDPAFETAKAAFEALPETERKGLQDALIWTGDYNSVVTGTFGRRTYDALLAYGKRNGSAGPPDAAGRATLLKAGEAARGAARFVVKPDAASGATLGVPERLLPKRTPQPGGTRWQSADGRITVETKSFPAGETGLDAVFARITAPSPDRRVTYKIQRPDFLVVSAETATGKSYIRYAAGEAGLRGLTIGYDKVLSVDVDKLVIAIANSFVPFPEVSAAPTVPSGPIATVAPVRPVLPTPSAPTATGLVVGPGRVLTSASALDGCATPSVGGSPARIATRDAARDLVLLETGRLPGMTPITPTLRAVSPAAGDDLMVLGANAEGVSVAPGQAGSDGNRVIAPLQPGAGGAPVLDRTGALAGLVVRFPAAPRLVAGIVPPASYGLVPVGALGAFLAQAGIANPPASASMRTGSVGAAAAGLAGAVVGITCRP
ncbi:trypsin-like peptidase domain-containing protein [Methylobacterium sp. BTF04]|uniref:S1 family peptidase n=1 Tax=Methylobacterium sp. BTF04 TaxID=2708300 RepID=UPI0013D1C5A4|nr:serine protease [Methylobacterium sp. BTF04]NEU10788.1 trypsin-like peptidase domain-containing protein [Methylobacterium sp. BTF04]